MVLSTFNSIVLQVAIVLLIIVLIVIGVIIYNSIHGSDVQFPPVMGTCPDYWNAVDISGIYHCENRIKIGSNDTESCNKFSLPIGGVCSKYKLAKTCGITWEGITNNDENRKKCT